MVVVEEKECQNTHHQKDGTSILNTKQPGEHKNISLHKIKTHENLFNEI